MSDDQGIRGRAEQRIGSVLHGKYRLDAILGVGGMAVVYAATHRNQKKFALKLLHPELSLRPELRTRFLREGYAANAVEHEGVVAILDDDVDEHGCAFLVMELLEGLDVQAWCARSGGRLPLQAVLVVAHQLLQVLSAAHAKGVIHRDIKPANLLVEYRGRLKVLDFGIARVRERALGSDATRTGAVLGTPAFMAPELASAQTDAIDARTDLWAVGATLFSLLSGQNVHPGEHGNQVLIRAATAEARSVLSVCPELPLPVVELVTRALAFDRGARFQSAEEMAIAVESASRALFGELRFEPVRALVIAAAARPEPAFHPSVAGGGVAGPTLSESSALGRAATESARPPTSHQPWLLPAARARARDASRRCSVSLRRCWGWHSASIGTSRARRRCLTRPRLLRLALRPRFRRVGPRTQFARRSRSLSIRNRLRWPRRLRSLSRRAARPPRPPIDKHPRACAKRIPTPAPRGSAPQKIRSTSSYSEPHAGVVLLLVGRVGCARHESEFVAPRARSER
ncbi:MAG: serine/threonine-protein kinase [Polyangiaceae bacterium]